MEQHTKRGMADITDFTKVFWQMACVAFCAGLAVSLAVAGLVLLIVRLGAT